MGKKFVPSITFHDKYINNSKYNPDTLGTPCSYYCLLEMYISIVFIILHSTGKQIDMFMYIGGSGVCQAGTRGNSSIDGKDNGSFSIAKSQ